MCDYIIVNVSVLLMAFRWVNLPVGDSTVLSILFVRVRLCVIYLGNVFLSVGQIRIKASSPFPDSVVTLKDFCQFTFRGQQHGTVTLAYLRFHLTVLLSENCLAYGCHFVEYFFSF